MTDARALADLHAITQARYAQRQQAFAKLVAEEGRLRAELVRLDEMAREAHAPDAPIGEMRAIGADVIWQGWTARTKTALNLRLAQVLSVKEQHLKEVRRAYGKVLVVEELQTQARRRSLKDAARLSLHQAIDSRLFR